MTTPKINTLRRGGARYYVNPETGDKVPGVTSIVGMLPKEFLKFWAAKSVATAAVDMLGEVVGIALRDRDAAIDMLKRAPDRDTKRAADAGSEAHDLFERIAKGESVPRQHPDVQPFVDHFREFLDVADPDFLFMEETVWSETHDYAGSFDAMATIRANLAVVGGKLLVIDNKTTRSGVHEEVALQLSAYRHADYILRPDGSRVPMPKIEGGAVLHVRPEGWQLVPVDCGPEVFEYFLKLRSTFDWDREVKATVLGRPVASGPESKSPRTRARKAAK